MVNDPVGGGRGRWDGREMPDCRGYKPLFCEPKVMEAVIAGEAARRILACDLVSSARTSARVPGILLAPLNSSTRGGRGEGVISGCK